MSIRHPLVELLKRAVAFRRIAKVMHKSHVARRMTPFEGWVEVVCVDRRLALNREVKL